MGIGCEVSEGSQFASKEKHIHGQSLDTLVVVQLEVYSDVLESRSMPGYLLSCEEMSSGRVNVLGPLLLLRAGGLRHRY